MTWSMLKLRLNRSITAIGSNDRRAILGICISLAMVTWIVFGRTAAYDFVNFDDDVYVYRNDQVANGLTWTSVGWAFTHTHSSNWHPLTWLSHMLDCQLYGLNAGGPHVTNVLLHTATAILLFLLLRNMTTLSWRSAFVAAVFAIHPLRVESVAWVAERKDVLSGLFFILTLWAYKSYTTHRTYRTYVLTLFLFALGLMCKPMLVTLPFVLLLLDGWPLGRVGRVSGSRFQVSGSGQVSGAPGQSSCVSVRGLVLEKVPFLVLAVASCVVTFVAQKNAMSALPLSARIGNALVSYAVYLRQMFYPTDLAVFYPHPENGLTLWSIFAAAVLLLVLSVFAVVSRRRQPAFLFGWLWYLVMLIPVVGLAQVGSQAHADRYTYLPQIGLYIALTWSVVDLATGWRHCRVALGSVSAVILVALILCARGQTSYWKNSESLWAHTLACTPDNAVARNNFGNALFDKGKLDAAIRNFRRALQLKPDHAEAHYNLANALAWKGETDDAIAQYRVALQLKPADAKAHYNLGVAFLAKQNFDAAVTEFQEALRFTPNDAGVRNNLGNALLQLGKVDEALAEYTKALQLKSDDPKAHYNLAIALLRSGRVNEAIVQFQNVLQLTPDDSGVRNNFGSVLFQKGEVDEALAEFRKVLQLKPDYVNAHFNLGVALLQKGSVDEALEHFQNVVQSNPNYAEAHYHCGSALLQKGRVNQAIACFRRALEIEPDNAEMLNDLAWELATAADASVRNGGEAIALAQRANQLTSGQDLDILGTLAAAYAESGRFDDAVKDAQAAIGLARAADRLDQLTQLERQLSFYQARLPLREGLIGNSQ